MRRCTSCRPGMSSLSHRVRRASYTCVAASGTRTKRCGSSCARRAEMTVLPAPGPPVRTMRFMRESPKSESRNPKKAGIWERGKSETDIAGFGTFGVSSLELVADFDIRISDFRLLHHRRSPQAPPDDRDLARVHRRVQGHEPSQLAEVREHRVRF